jgi:hypothetical protein
MVAIQRPTSIARRALIIDLPARKTTIASPKTIKPKYSGGAKRNAKRANGGATSINPNMPMVPATNEAMAEIPNAAPALPCRAS